MIILFFYCNFRSLQRPCVRTPLRAYAPACVRPCMRTPVRIAYACTHCVRLYALRTALNGRDFWGEVNGQAKTSKREGTY